MRISTTSIDDLLIIEPRVFEDERGFFMESWNQRAFSDAVGQPVEFVQDNHSRSCAGVLRGIHHQVGTPQGKLVRVARGRIFDVAVDLRRGSPNFGMWAGVELSETNRKQLWIPPGFAHGFLVLSESADLLYKTTEYYAPERERCLAWDDTDLGINWPSNGSAPILSTRDANGTSLRQIEVGELVQFSR